MEVNFGWKKYFWQKYLLLKLLCPKVVVVAVLFLSFNPPQPEWGFWAHKRINRLAVFRLPPEMQIFYKRNLDFITENAVNPDRRRYAVVGEAERHFIDLDVYGDSALYKLPRFWSEAIKRMGEDSLRKHGMFHGTFKSALISSQKH
jgi:hypothetical protein